MKVHAMFVIGNRCLEANAVSAHLHSKGNLGPRLHVEVIAQYCSDKTPRRATGTAAESVPLL